jgi:peptidoglycan/LPS O-acetylase OafA/YrhL
VGIVLACFVGYLAITFWVVPIVTQPVSMPFVRVKPELMSINVSYQYGFLRCLFGFVIGMMMYQGYTERFARKFLGNGYTLIALALGMTLCLHFAVPDVFSVIFFPFILLSTAYGSEGMNTFFNTNALQRLGDWSFSIYLVHQPLLYTIGTIKAIQGIGKPAVVLTGPPPKMDMFTGWMVCVGFIAITLFVSYLTYRFIEVPARNRINQWAKKEE